MTKYDCCSGRSNSGWGLAGVSCEPCTPFDGTSNLPPFKPNQPSSSYLIINSSYNDETICIFKTRIHDYLGENINRRSTTHIKHFHDGFFGTLLTQIKLNLSPLRSHLYKYNIIDNPFCPACGDEIETTMHYFLECKIYDLNRQKMLMNLFKLDPSLTVENKPAILNFIVSGSSCADMNQQSLINNKIFLHVKIYITTTKRFSV